MFDTHCHLTHDRFQGEVPAVLSRAAEAGVEGVVTVASDLDDTRAALGMLNGVSEAGSVAPLPRHRLTAGIHPHHAEHLPRGARARLVELLHSDPRIVAVGECGLDFHYDLAPREAQFRAFDLQIEVAAETALPLVVHCRDAEEEMKGRVRQAGAAGVRGVLHCFPGDLELLEVALESGWSVSFTGLVTFRSFDGLESVRRVPADRYMLETDGPYLAPVPRRGQRNEPAFLPHIRDRVAELREEDPARVEQDTDTNARRFFGF